jgi:hypothetical protein
MTRSLSSCAGVACAAALCGAFLLAQSASAMPESDPQPVSPANAQAAQQSAQQPSSSTPSSPLDGNAPTDKQDSADQLPGTITGTVLDATGAIVSGARVKLTHGNASAAQETVTGSNGQFSFSNVLPGPFQLSISLPRFATQTSSGLLRPGDTFIVPAVTLPLAAVTTEVDVMPQEEVAEAQIKQQEKQRILGVVPNFYVTYLPDAVPLTSKQKFELAWKSSIDPVTFVINGGVAGIQQAENQFSGFGQGFSGYAKRYGASYGDIVAGTFLSGAILPSLLKQDPRYFYKGTGSAKSRLLYAIANAVICKGDNKRWQPNYSNILGNLAAGGIANLYYPPQNRDGAALTFESALIGIGATAATNILEEFVIKKFTPKVSSDDPDKPSRKISSVSEVFANEGL